MEHLLLDCWIVCPFEPLGMLAPLSYPPPPYPAPQNSQLQCGNHPLIEENNTLYKNKENMCQPRKDGNAKKADIPMYEVWAGHFLLVNSTGKSHWNQGYYDTAAESTGNDQACLPESPWNTRTHACSPIQTWKPWHVDSESTWGLERRNKLKWVNKW